MIIQTEGYKAAVISMLLRMMAVDGHKDKREFVYILRVAYEMGMTPEDIAALTPEDLVNQKFPEGERERMTILYYLLFMMSTDGAVSAEEELLIKDLGYQLGFRIDLVSDLIMVIRSYGQMPVPTEELLDKIRTYLN